ncbi:hypothetical protein ACHAPI_011080 [Fusarium lateritium]
MTCGILIADDSPESEWKLIPSSKSMKISLVKKGIRLSFPRDPDRSVFTWYSPDLTMTDSNHYHITIELPVKGFNTKCGELTLDDTAIMKAAALEDPQGFMVFNINVPEKSNTNIIGFGLPFRSSDVAADSWVNKTTLIHGVSTLPEILSRRDFTLLVYATSIQLGQFVRTLNLQSSPTPYGFGENHTWDMTRYGQQIPKNRGCSFTPEIRFQNANERDTALTQTHVQDVWDFQDALEDIRQTELPALI